MIPQWVIITLAPKQHSLSGENFNPAYSHQSHSSVICHRVQTRKATWHSMHFANYLHLDIVHHWRIHRSMHPCTSQTNYHDLPQTATAQALGIAQAVWSRPHWHQSRQSRRRWRCHHRWAQSCSTVAQTAATWPPVTPRLQRSGRSRCARRQRASTPPPPCSPTCAPRHRSVRPRSQYYLVLHGIATAVRHMSALRHNTDAIAVHMLLRGTPTPQSCIGYTGRNQSCTSLEHTMYGTCIITWLIHGGRQGCRHRNVHTGNGRLCGRASACAGASAIRMQGAAIH